MNHTHESNGRQQDSQNIFQRADWDDRITCAACRNRPGRECLAWREAKAIKGYSPDAELPRRCDAYRPGRDSEDQRTGRERWPTLDRTMDNQKEQREWKR